MQRRTRDRTPVEPAVNNGEDREVKRGEHNVLDILLREVVAPSVCGLFAGNRMVGSLQQRSLISPQLLLSSLLFLSLSLRLGNTISNNKKALIWLIFMIAGGLIDLTLNN